jgi:thioredoxin 1
MPFRLVFLIASMLAVISPAQAGADVHAGAQGLFTATDAGFEEMVSGSQLPVVVLAAAGWCHQCQPMMPIIEGLQAEMQGRVRFATLDVDANPKTASKLGIMSIPVIYIFKDGKMISRQVGSAPKSKLVEWIDTTLGVSADRRSR